jgi:hypothetical protein
LATKVKGNSHLQKIQTNTFFFREKKRVICFLFRERGSLLGSIAIKVFTFFLVFLSFFFFFFSVPHERRMEMMLEASSVPVHVIIDDVHVVWISGRSLAKLLNLAEARVVLQRFRSGKSGNPVAEPKDRTSFPGEVLSKDETFAGSKTHEFVRLQDLFLALKEKYFASLSVLLAAVLHSMTCRLVESHARAELLALDPARRASRSIVSQRRRTSSIISDVLVPPPPATTPSIPAPTFLSTTLIPGAPQRISFRDQAFSPGDDQTPFYGRRAKVALPTRVLRPVVRSLLEQAPVVYPSKPVRFSVQPTLHGQVLMDHGVEVAHRMPGALSRFGPIVSNRSIDDVSTCASFFGHLVEYCGDVAQYGKFSWVVKLKSKECSSALNRAKDFYGLVDSFVLFARGQDDRDWFGESAWISEQALKVEMARLLIDPLPQKKPHPDFANDGFDLLSKQHPWIVSSESSLSDHNQHVFQEGLFLVSKDGLAGLLKGVCCQKARVRVSSVVCLVSAVVVECDQCGGKSQSVSLTPNIELNKRAFCLSLMSGRGFAVERFLSWLGVGNGKVQKRDNLSTWMPQLLAATTTIFNESKEILTTAFVLGSSPVVSADVAYKRNAKAYQQGLGAALSSILSVCDNRLGKVLCLFLKGKKWKRCISQKKRFGCRRLWQASLPLPQHMQPVEIMRRSSSVCVFSTKRPNTHAKLLQKTWSLWLSMEMLRCLQMIGPWQVLSLMHFHLDQIQ